MPSPTCRLCGDVRAIGHRLRDGDAYRVFVCHTCRIPVVVARKHGPISKELEAEMRNVLTYHMWQRHPGKHWRLEDAICHAAGHEHFHGTLLEDHCAAR